MATASTLLALRLAGQDHALEPGREYVLGSDKDCDLRLTTGARPQQARLNVRADGATLQDLGGSGTLCNGLPVTTVELTVGDVLQFGEHHAFVVLDDGTATIVPIPAMRAAAGERKVRDAAAALRVEAPTTLAAQLGNELRRAPWFAVSVALHVLLLFLLWLYLPAQNGGGKLPARITVDLGAVGEGVVDDRPAPPEVQTEAADEPFEEVVPPDPQPEPPPPLPAEGPAPRDQLPSANFSLRSKHAPGNGTGQGGATGVGSGAFLATIGELRQSGLEIVFVFDSTGSMQRTIADTKATIDEILKVLRHLVPDASFGLVTYRDHGHEEYLTREVPLGLDFWRAVNFMQFVAAEGGGDQPEAVRDGLAAAFGQHWRPGARRVVVLAGDAPPHPQDVKPLLAQVRAFAQDGHSFVHTLVTTTAPSSDAGTQQAFAEIAAAGHGLCERIDARDRVLQRVLAFAFGREFDEDIRAVVAAVEQDDRRIDVQALDLVRRAGQPLRDAMSKTPVPQTVMNALVRRPNRAAAAVLLDLLAAPKTPEPTRQAAAFALQRMLELTLPPVDPIGDRELTTANVDRLRQVLGKLPE